MSRQREKLVFDGHSRFVALLARLNEPESSDVDGLSVHYSIPGSVQTERLVAMKKQRLARKEAPSVFADTV